MNLPLAFKTTDTITNVGETALDPQTSNPLVQDGDLLVMDEQYRSGPFNNLDHRPVGYNNAGDQAQTMSTQPPETQLPAKRPLSPQEELSRNLRQGPFDKSYDSSKLEQSKAFGAETSIDTHRDVVSSDNRPVHKDTRDSRAGIRPSIMRGPFIEDDSEEEDLTPRIDNSRMWATTDWHKWDKYDRPDPATQNEPVDDDDEIGYNSDVKQFEESHEKELAKLRASREKALQRKALEKVRMISPPS